MSSINLERACDATADSGYSKKWTFSAWVKRGLISTEQGLFANKRTDNWAGSSGATAKIKERPLEAE